MAPWSQAIVVDESFGPWALWLRAAASSPQLDVPPLTVDVAIESELLGDAFPADPADCLIAATARVHDVTLITPDTGIRKSGAVRTLWYLAPAYAGTTPKNRPNAISARMRRTVIGRLLTLNNVRQIETARGAESPTRRAVWCVGDLVQAGLQVGTT